MDLRVVVIAVLAGGCMGQATILESRARSDGGSTGGSGAGGGSLVAGGMAETGGGSSEVGGGFVAAGGTSGGSTTGGGSSQAGGTAGGAVVSGGNAAGGTSTAGGPAGGAAGGIGLPFVYTRADVGTPLTPTELAAATDTFKDLLINTNYFQAVDDRVLGWPQSDPQQRYWYGTWWSGAGFEKTQGQLKLVHVNVGADNNGIGTSFVLESMCAAQRLWPSTQREAVVRRLVRGFTSWMLAMERTPNDQAGPILARAAYPQNVTSTDFGRTVEIDYSADRPGIDSYTLYVHLPANPHWGDLYVKNKRSKDDIGHMLRAIASLEDCAPTFSAATTADFLAMKAAYVRWAQRVEADGWAIATLNQSGNVELPAANSTMSRYILTANAECTNVLALRLFARGDPGSFACGTGIHALEGLVLSNVSNGEILRSYHVAAARQAVLAGQHPVARDLLTGLTRRIEDGMTAAESNSFPVHLNEEKLAKLLVHSAAAGVPLTSREVRWLHGFIQRSLTGFQALDPNVFRLFVAATPDGAYDFTPEAPNALDFRFIGTVLSTCTSNHRNPASRPVLDCARLAAWSP